MKRKLLSVVALVSILAMLFSVAAAPANVSGITFSSIEFVPNKGIVLKFALTGDPGKEDFVGSAFVSGTEYPMDCNVSDDGETLVCVVGGGLNKMDGMKVYGSVNGYGFSAVVPGSYECAWWWVKTTTLAVYDLDGDGDDELNAYTFVYAVETMEDIHWITDIWGGTLDSKSCQTAHIDYYDYWGDYQGEVIVDDLE